MTTNQQFTQLIDQAIAQSFTGWDFAFVAGRLTEQDTAWRYRDLVAHHAPRATALLDMCTGGGEFLDGFDELPKVTYATEGFQPNVSIAKKRLEPRGVNVVAVNSDDALPLPTDTFDLVINRHGAYSANELQRIMNPTGATFLTQQVGSENANGLNQALGAPSASAPVWRLEVAVDELAALGYSITRSEEEFPTMSFTDIGAIVFYLKAIPWQIPNFDIADYRDQLFTLHQQIERDGTFEVQAHRFLVEAYTG